MKSELYFERCAHGEIHGAPTGADGARVEELRHADAAFLALHPSASFFRDVRAKRRGNTLWRSAGIGSALAACLVLALVLPSVLPDRDGTRMKGSELNMFVYHRTGGGVEILPEDLPLSEGDEIQLAYFARTKVYGVILSMDGRGNVTRQMPLHGEDALELKTTKYALLPYSYRLDDAPHFEDFYFIVSSTPFKVADVQPYLIVAYGNRTAVVQLPTPFRYSMVHVVKGIAKESE